MEQNQILIISVTAVVVLALILFLVRQNKKDREEMNPDEADSVKEVHTDQERKRDRI